MEGLWNRAAQRGNWVCPAEREHHEGVTKLPLGATEVARATAATRPAARTPPLLQSGLACTLLYESQEPSANDFPRFQRRQFGSNSSALNQWGYGRQAQRSAVRFRQTVDYNFRAFLFGSAVLRILAVPEADFRCAINAQNGAQRRIEPA